MTVQSSKRFSVLFLVQVLFVALPFVCSSSAQVGTDRSYRNSQRNNSETDFDAQRLTQQVTLSSDKILEILRGEPGLTLEVKRALVRKAFEQGRLLDPEELTDTALFELIERDNNVRIVATNEILDRKYLRAKPTREDLDSEREAYSVRGPVPGETDITDLKQAATKSQEDRYWAAYEAQRQKAAEEALKNAPSGQLPSRQLPVEPPQQTPDLRQQRPQLQMNRAAMDRDIPDMMVGEEDALAMSRIRPDELPDVLQKSGVSRASLADRNSAGSAAGLGSALGSSMSMGSNIDATSLSNLGQDQYAQEASLERRRQPRFPRYPIGDVDETTAIRHRPNPYANVPSLFDIYSQVSSRQPKLDRFGANIFQDDNGNFDDLPMDLPVGPEYILGPGDGLKIDLWGGVSQRLLRTVDREGRIGLPEAGTVLVAGKSMGDVQKEVQQLLRTQFRDVQANVSLSRLRTVRVYVVGDVQHPGAYDISSLSSPLNALYAAGGPTSRGSLRIVKHFRGKELVQEVDLYDLILHGTRGEIKTLQPGDTVLLPPIGPQVKVEGMVRRPAIYELNGERSLAEVLELAGGVLPTGTLRHIEVERIQAHEGRTMLSLDIPENNDQQKVTKALMDFSVQNGDAVRISPILPYSDKTVYLDGHVFHPGKYPYKDGMTVRDLLKSYKELLPEPYQKHAEIIRLQQPDFQPTVISFNLSGALSGDTQDLKLQPFDTVRIFGRFDFEDAPAIAVVGEVRDPGPHRTNGVTKLSDAIYLAGGLTPDAMLDDVQIFRYSHGTKVQVLSANLGAAIAGDVTNNIALQPKDRVIVHRSKSKLDPPSVTIEGEVAKPGRYPLGSEMTAAELVRVAGGFKRSSYTESADLTRYIVENGKRIIGEHQEIPIAQALAGEPDTDVRLHDGDVLTIKQIGGWKDIGGAIAVKGEVIHPGVYGIQEGERLSSVLRRTGGFRPEAYPYGAIFERVQVRELAEKNRQDLIKRIETGSDVNVSPSLTGAEQAAVLQAALQQQKTVLNALKNQPATGRMVVHISMDISKWENTVDDIVVRPGDTITIPKQPYFVLVTGQVYNSSTITFTPGKNVSWYLKQAGGPTELANTGRIFVVRADGSIVGKDSSGWWGGGVMGVKLRPGDSIVVPEKFVTGSSAFKTILSTAQVFSQIAFTAAVATR